MGCAVGGCRTRTLAGLLAALAGLLAMYPTAAHAEPPVTDLLVAPAGAELVTRDGGNRSTANGDFLHHHEGLDVTVVDGASGVIRSGGDLAVLVTVVRLATEQQAAEALAAMARPASSEEIPSGPAGDQAAMIGGADPVLEPLPAPRSGAVGRRSVTGSMSLVEFARATGRDLVVFAQLENAAEPLPSLHAALDAHRMAFPDVTMPADAGGRPSWGVLAAGAGAVLVVAGLVVAATRARRRGSPRRRSAPPAPASPASPVRTDAAPPARANW